MNGLLLAVLSLVAPGELPDGSLVFLERCNYFVERYTNAPIGHVAVAVQEEGVTWIYEATPGHVRRVTWESTSPNSPPSTPIEPEARKSRSSRG